MMTIEHLKSIGKDDLSTAAKSLTQEELPQLVEWLATKDDEIRYPAFLLLQNRSAYSDDVYPYWDVFRGKLGNENSYQRNIGITLIACNVKWDQDRRMDDTLDEYLSLLTDEKPITIRQCIQGLSRIVPYTPHLHAKIADRLMDVQISRIRASMQKLVLMDILNILAFIRKYQTRDTIEKYISDALAGEILDKKAKKQLEQAL